MVNTRVTYEQKFTNRAKITKEYICIQTSRSYYLKIKLLDGDSLTIKTYENRSNELNQGQVLNIHFGKV